MNQRDFQRYDRWLGHYAAWVRDGCSKPGIYQTSQWPSGKPESHGEPRRATKRRNPLLPYCQPKETRCTVPRLPCMSPVDDDYWLTHAAVLQMPQEYKQFIILAWIRRYTDMRDLSVILGLPSKQVRRWKVKVFDRIPVRV